MYPSQGRFWLAVAGVCLACCSSCNQPPQKSTLGNLPGQTASDLEPKVNATTYFAHGHLLERQGQFERAVVQYRKAVALQPDFLSARNRLGITLNKLGRHAEASAQFQQAIAKRPELAYLHNNLGFSLYLEGRYAEAQAALTQALSLKPDFSRAHLNHALVLARLERFDDAFSELMQVGDEADACFNMGILLTEAEQYADAARYLESALALRPSFDAAQQQLRDVSRLAAETEARRAAQPALAAQTTGENATPEPTGALVADTVTERATPEPAPATEETAVEPTEAVVTPAATEDPVSTTTVTAAKRAEWEGPAAEPTEPAVADVAEVTTVEPMQMVGADAESETVSPEPAGTGVADANTETTALEATEAAVEEVAVERAIVTPADAVGESVMPEATPTLVADVVIPAEEGPVEASPPLTTATEPEPARRAQERGINPEFLFALIDEALTALMNQSDDLEMLWCQVGYYLFPETAPDAAVPAPDNAPEEPGAFPENIPEEWILDWPY